MKTEKLVRIKIESPSMSSEILTTDKKSLSHLRRIGRIKKSLCKSGEPFSIKIEPAGEILI